MSSSRCSGLRVPVLALAYGTGALGTTATRAWSTSWSGRFPGGGLRRELLAAAVIVPGDLSLWRPLLPGPFEPGGKRHDIPASAGHPPSAAPTCASSSLVVAFRHSTVIAVAPSFFRVIIVLMPGILKRISIQFYASSPPTGGGGAGDLRAR
jgi:hypothetical protein